MRFGSTSVRAWAKEWRASAWRETIPLASGRECPDCLATVCGGKSWRGHAEWHAEQLEWRLRVNDVIRQLAAKAGLHEHLDADEDGDWGDMDDDERLTAKARAVLGGGGGAGYVLGNGPLPAETRGGGE